MGHTDGFFRNYFFAFFMTRKPFKDAWDADCHGLADRRGRRSLQDLAMTQKEQSERVAREEKYNSIEKVRFLWLNFGK